MLAQEVDVSRERRDERRLPSARARRAARVAALAVDVDLLREHLADLRVHRAPRSGDDIAFKSQTIPPERPGRCRFG